MKKIHFLKKILAMFLVVILIAPAILSPKKAWAEELVFDPQRFIQEAINFITDNTLQIGILEEETITAMKTTITSVKTTYLALKEAVLDPIARLLGTQLTNMLTQQMFSFIAKGNSGAPSFVTNPQQYFGSVAQESTQVFLIDLKNNRPDRMASINSVVRQRIIEENYVDEKKLQKSTFPGGDDGYKAHRKDPSKCTTGNSWHCYFATLEPQNDPFQIYQIERQKLEAKRTTDVTLSQDEILAASGYHTLKDCIERDGGTFGYGGVSTPITNSTLVSFLATPVFAATDEFILGNRTDTDSSGTWVITPGGRQCVSGACMTGGGGTVGNTGPGSDIIDPFNGKVIGQRPGGTQTGGAGGMSGNCLVYLNKTPGDALAGQVNLYLNNALKNLQNVDEVGEVISLGISGVQKWMNGNGLTSAITNEVGSKGIDQGNGVTTFPLQQ